MHVKGIRAIVDGIAQWNGIKEEREKVKGATIDDFYCRDKNTRMGKGFTK